MTSAREHLVMALDVEPGGHVEDADSEPVSIETTADEVALVLEDGRRLIFDRGELVAAVAAEPGAKSEAA